LEENSEQPERPIDPHRVLGLDPPPLGHEPVDLLDPALGIAAVAAHVPLADGTVRARDGIGTADDPDDQVAGRKRARRARVQDAAERLVPEDETIRAPGAPAL